ncbi:MAG: D-alanyl-D-alanine carboxypeptidase/D-alanyl-D-alanine-endopeptidase [bacterium]|nr:D-alanyl-D-alanine carboxypeptidase/D-alanyl-D-alanine-endopeptidase [bacterium]
MPVRSFAIALVAASWFTSLGSVAGASVAPPQAGDLTDDVQRLINKGKLGKALAGVSVIDTESGEILVAVNASRPLTPASNQKLLTSGAALLILGPDFTFKTELQQSGDRIVLVGGGDPSLADPEILAHTEPRLSVTDVLDLLADSAVKAGVKSATELVVDDRIFDREFLHPDWPARNFLMPHSAEIAGLNFNCNVIAVFAKPSREGVGHIPITSVEPDAPWIPIQNRGRTVSQGQNTPWLSREPDQNRFVLRGDVRYPVSDGIRVPIHTAPDLTGRLLASRLNAKGVTIAGGQPTVDTEPTGVRLANADESFADPRTLAVIATPMGEILERCNSDSMNLYAECLLKRCGHEVTKEPGSWSNGAAVVRMLITQKIGPEYAASTTIVDGSGLSRQNSIAPATITRWLDLIADDASICDLYTNSMASPGEGTLRKRFQGVKLESKVFAKSGFIDGVRCLSGYVVDADTGHRVAFSIMVNDIKTGDQTQAALELHEDVVKLIDRYLSRRAEPGHVEVGG